MMRKGANLPSIGEFNQSVVLDTVRLSPDGVSRVEIAERTGLSPQTVTNACRRLLADGLIREGERLSSGPGKPRTSLLLVPESRMAVGIHLDPSFIMLTIVDLGGNVVARMTLDTPRVLAPDDVVTSIAASVRELVDGAGVDRERLLGVGIAAPGPIDLAHGTINDPPLMDGWEHVPLRDAIGAALGMPVTLEKDVTAATIGELWANHEAARDDFALFYIGTGTGLGVALDHGVLRGATSNLGDIGHLPVPGSDAPCRCGNRGCLGEVTAPALLVRRGAELGVIDLPDLEDHAAVADAYAAVAAAAEKDGRVRALVEEIAAGIASAVVVIANLLDVSDIVFSGPFWSRIAPIALPEVGRLVAASRSYVLPHPIEVTTSTLGADAAAIGAGCQVLRAAFDPSAAALLVGSE
jgi:predicted NBD/HSP70 family sugar kinase